MSDPILSRPHPILSLIGNCLGEVAAWVAQALFQNKPSTKKE